jgi:hypothetical protein
MVGLDLQAIWVGERGLLTDAAGNNKADRRYKAEINKPWNTSKMPRFSGFVGGVGVKPPASRPRHEGVTREPAGST